VLVKENQTKIGSGTQPRIINLLAARVLLTVLAASAAMVGAHKSAEATQLENRYLLVVETSSCMANRVKGISATLEGALAARMKDQLRTGDTLGLWTFNEELYTGMFPLQTWSPETEKKIGPEVTKHLRQQRYTKRPRLDNVMVALQQVIRDSEFITVVLVTSGQNGIKGTPFDEAINNVFRDWSKKQEEARMPLVTVLRARRGRITDYRVSVTPFPIEMPPLPVELDPHAVAQKAKPRVPAHTELFKPQPNAPIGQPLIVSGKKAASTVVTNPPQPVKIESGKVIAALSPEPDRTNNQISLAAQTIVARVTTNEVPKQPVAAQPLIATNAVRELVQATAPAVEAPTAGAAPGPMEPTAPALPAALPFSADHKPAPLPRQPSPQADTAIKPALPAAPASASLALERVPAAMTIGSVQTFIWIVGGMLLLALLAIVLVAVRSSKRSHHHISLITESLGPDGP
jgi:hypothetical protein